jgi:hypothetical protein
MHGGYSLLMPEHSRQTLLLCPTAVAVHDNGNVPRDALLNYFVFLAHALIFEQPKAAVFSLSA